jgi:hypothetical protein
MLALCMREEINLTQMLSKYFRVLNAVRLSQTLLVCELPFGTSGTSLCFRLVHPSQLTLRQARYCGKSSLQ